MDVRVRKDSTSHDRATNISHDSFFIRKKKIGRYSNRENKKGKPAEKSSSTVQTEEESRSLEFDKHCQLVDGGATHRLEGELKDF